MSKLPNVIRGVSPCKDCTERFSACSGKCPKDARGEYGYGAWKQDIERVKAARAEYRRYEYRHKRTTAVENRRKNEESTNTFDIYFDSNFSYFNIGWMRKGR